MVAINLLKMHNSGSIGNKKKRTIFIKQIISKKKIQPIPNNLKTSEK